MTAPMVYPLRGILVRALAGLADDSVYLREERDAFQRGTDKRIEQIKSPEITALTQLVSRSKLSQEPANAANNVAFVLEQTQLSNEQWRLQLVNDFGIAADSQQARARYAGTVLTLLAAEYLQKDPTHTTGTTLANTAQAYLQGQHGDWALQYSNFLTKLATPGMNPGQQQLAGLLQRDSILRSLGAKQETANPAPVQQPSPKPTR